MRLLLPNHTVAMLKALRAKTNMLGFSPAPSEGLSDDSRDVYRWHRSLLLNNTLACVVTPLPILKELIANVHKID